MKDKVVTLILVLVFIVLLLVISNFMKQGNNIEENINEEVSNVEFLEVTSKNFDEEVLNSEKKVLIDFYADWCQPCKILEPTVKEIASENEDIKVIRINIDEESDLAAEYQIMSIPTLVVIENGKEKDRSIGVVSKNKILNMIK